MPLRAHPNHSINIESNQRGLVHYAAGITDLVKPNLLDLFSLHVQARGSLVETPDEAEAVFSVDEGITPFSFEKIVSEFLG